jgi:acyl-CoA reductase-like NAD-dependent aldehyde dehydrogenase
MATDRILVHTSVAREFIDTVKTTLACTATGDAPLPVMATTASKSRLHKALAEAVSKGANVVWGSEKQETVPGASVVPTILKDVDTSTVVWNEENFGPLVGIATVESNEEAVKIANSSGYGLSASIFTKDLRKGLALAKQIQTG